MNILWSEARALWRARTLVWVLTRREVASRHSGTALGIVWPYLQPLLTVAAYYLVFDVVFGMRLGEQAPTRAVGAYLVVGALPWMAFCDAVQRGMTSLIDAGSLLHKNPLPPVLFTSRSVLASFSIYGPLLLLVAVAYIPAHGLKPAILALLPLLLLQMLLCMVLGYALAILAARAARRCAAGGLSALRGHLSVTHSVSHSALSPGLALGTMAQPDDGSGHGISASAAARSVAPVERMVRNTCVGVCTVSGAERPGGSQP